MEKPVLDRILRNHHLLHEQLNHDHMVMREAAAEALLGSVFAGAPTSNIELKEQPFWKKMLHTSGHRLSSVDHINEFKHDLSAEVGEDDEIGVFDGKSAVLAIERRKQCYHDEYARISSLRNDLIAELELSDDLTVSASLSSDIDRLGSLLDKIEMRLKSCVGGVKGDTQTMTRRLGSMYR